MEDDDIYSALVGGAPSDKARQMALAQSLRQKDAMGQIMQLSGDRVIGPMGQQQIKQSMQGGADVQSDREAQNTLAETQKYRDAQAAQQANSLAEEKRWHNIMGSIAQQKADTGEEKVAKGTNGKPIPVPQLKDLEAMKDSVNGVLGAQSSFTPGVGGTGRGLANTIAANVPSLASKNMIDAQNWWANYGRAFTLPELKSTIGMRHNQDMQNLFESYHLNQNMDDDQIRNNLSQIGSQGVTKMSQRVDALRRQGYNIGGYEQYLPENLPGASSGGSTPPPAAAPAGGAGASYLKRVRSSSKGLDPVTMMQLSNPQSSLFNNPITGMPNQ